MASLTRDDILHVLESAPWRQLALGSVGALVTYNVASFVYDYWYKSRSPLRMLPAPKESANWIFGHLPVMMDGEKNETQERWVAELGETFAVRALFGKYLLVTTDTRANAHILSATHIYQKPDIIRRATKRFLGEGVFLAEGEEHKHQRRMLNPAFGFAHTRDLTPIFLEKGAQLREIWNNKCVEAGGSVHLDALDWISRATFDSIGKAGFDYDFGTMNEDGETNEMAEAFNTIFRADATPFEEMRGMLNDRFPLLRAIAPGKRSRDVDKGKIIVDRVCKEIVQKKKAAVLAELGGDSATINKSSVAGNDIITLLLRANLAKDVDPSSRLSDEQIQGQIPTFLVAGHESTSETVVWAMYSLAVNPEMQTKLREELRTISTDTPTLDMLNTLTYLDQVCREVLRLNTVVSFVQREAMQDDVIPLGKPVKDRNGQLLTHINVQKGDQVMIPIWLINRSKSIWGPDADRFRPERWENIPAEAAGIPGIAPNLMSFYGGPRSCIGFRFAIAEMKSLLFHVVRGFEFKLAVDEDALWSRSGILMRPQLRGSNKTELPVVLTPLE
ncbi:cytochrome P450 [Exidia glandulosa HHB12029]|uniref:Cytochrome P450 n=1 Tax=Exidia glandulosa HHB12029 TaxID=1314781 RepID=A0A165HIW3_EXIGL|nr:cytochrome P450 [Exidia glandulosa HHB12029]